MTCQTCHRPLHIAEEEGEVCLPCAVNTMDTFAFAWWLGGVYNYRVRAKIKVTSQPKKATA